MYINANTASMWCPPYACTMHEAAILYTRTNVDSSGNATRAKDTRGEKTRRTMSIRWFTSTSTVVGVTATAGEAEVELAFFRAAVLLAAWFPADSWLVVPVPYVS